MDHILLLPLMAMVACGPCPPVEDIVIEGTPESTALVRQAMQDLQEWTDRRSFCVARVVVSPDFVVGHDGSYDSLSGVIELREGQDNLYGTAVHEACHGIDKAVRVSQPNRDAFPYDPEAGDYAQRDEASRAREAFARTCEAGPINLHAVVEAERTCDHGVWVEGAELTLDRVFEATPVPAADRATFASVASWAVPSSFGVVLPLTVEATPDEMRVAVMTGDGRRTALLDPQTGSLRELSAEQVGEPEPWPGDPLPWSWRDPTVGTFSDGHALVVFRQRMPNGQEITGVAGWDGGWTLPTPPCLGQDAAFVTLDGAPWLVEAEAGEVRWSRWQRI